jgi:chromate transporter
MKSLVYFLLFFKATLFSKSSVGNLPDLRQELLVRGWAQETNFGEAIAIGQIGTGSNALWAVSLGFLTYGWLGALLALLAITLPHLLILPLAAIYQRVEHLAWAQALLRGLSLVSIGFLFAAAWSIFGSASHQKNWIGLLICLVACLLCLSRRIGSLPVLLAAAGAGYLLYR